MKNFIKFVCIILGLSIILVGCNNHQNNTNNNKNIASNNNVDLQISINDSTENTTNINSNNKRTNKNTNKNNSIKVDLNKTNAQNDSNNNSKKITIVLDPGHSSKSSNETEYVSPDSKEKKLKDTTGAISINSKIPEYEITNKISKTLKQLLEKDGYNVILTKDNISEQRSNIERANIGNMSNANLLIRIHCDSVDSQSANGASMLVPEVKGYVTKDIAQKSYLYGEKIIDAYTKTTGIYNRGVIKRDDLTGFNWSKVPVVLLELGFISNPKEDAYLSNNKNYNEICEGIKKGIDNCFK